MRLLRRPPSLAAVDVGLMAAGLVLLAAFPPELVGDGVQRFADLSNVVHGTLPRERFSLIGPLFSLPLWPLGRLLGGRPLDGVLRFNLVLVALSLPAFWLLLRRRMEAETLRSFLLLLLVCSLIGHEVPAYGAEVFTALLVSLGAALVVVHRRDAGWIPVVVGAAGVPASAGGVALIAAGVAVMRRRWRYVLAVVAVAVLVEAEVLVRNGSLVSDYFHDHGIRTLMPYSGREGFSYPFFLGLISILFSFGKGLVWFTPGLLLPVRRALRAAGRDLDRLYLVWMLFLAGLVLVYSRWWAWYGGFAWGPRFFVFASVPASLALAVALRHGRSPWLRLAALAALALSAWVGLDGVALGRETMALGQPQCTIPLEHLCWYVPEFSVLWHPFVAGSALDLRGALYAAFVGTVALRLAAPALPGLARDARAGAARLARAQRSGRRWQF